MPAARLDDDSVAAYLRQVGLADAGELRVDGAGDGNINWVRRVRAGDGHSWIVKQARGNLEKFPEYEADPQRLVFEARYMEVARPYDDDDVLPRVHHFDELNHVLILEDLGDVDRMGESLASGRDIDAELALLARFLGRVHRATSGDASLASRFANDQMRRLHGDHIFVLPFRANDFDLEPRLRERATELWADAALVDTIDGRYQRYLTPSGALVHADVQSSNVLLPPSGPALLDGEIAHIGDPAFDLGTLVAHVYLPALARQQVGRARKTATMLWEAYAGPATITGADVAAYAAIEMLRRTIGAARVEPMRETDAALRCVEFARSVLAGGASLFG